MIKKPEQTAEPVLIIGAGPAGLAASAELRRFGVASQIIDRTDAVASLGAHALRRSAAKHVPLEVGAPYWRQVRARDAVLSATTGSPRSRRGLHFLGYARCMGVIGRDAERVMRHVLDELTTGSFSGS